jgi:hypothetical protein
VNKTFTFTIEWGTPQLELRTKLIHGKWNDLAWGAIVEGFKPFSFKHSDINKPITTISVSAYKPSWFVSLLYSLSHRGSNSFLPRWRWWMK